MLYIFRKITAKEVFTSIFFLLKKSQCLPMSYNIHECCLRNRPKFFMTVLKQHSLKFCNYSASCWHCKAPRENELICGTCSSIQRPILPIDYFELLNIDKIFDIDGKNLVNNFKKLQMILHPDKFSLKSETERAIAEEFSALVNKAYSTLRNPLSRGIYLLESAGVSIKEGSSVNDPEFLLEIMELNEAVEKAKTLEDLKSIDQDVRKLSLEATSNISKAFKNNHLNEAKLLIIKLRYYTNITSKARERLLEFGFV